MATWNVLSLNRAGSLRKLKEELTKYRIGIAAIQEIRWPGTVIMDTGDFTILYSGSMKSTLGTGFVVSKEYKGSIMEFKPINERICTLRIRARLFNIALICVHAPTEETKEEVKDRFYEELENVYDGAAGHDVKMISGDMNAKIGRKKNV